LISDQFAGQKEACKFAKVREGGFDLSSYTFDPQTELLLLLGHRDSTKNCVKEYFGKQMSKRVLPNALPGELVWQQADRPKRLEYTTHSSGYYLICTD
jgi:hypothetical protein